VATDRLREVVHRAHPLARGAPQRKGR